MSRRITKAQIGQGQKTARGALVQMAVRLATEAAEYAERVDDMRWALESPDMPKAGWAIIQGPYGKGRFFRWLRDYREHIEKLSPAKRAKIRKLR